MASGCSVSITQNKVIEQSSNSVNNQENKISNQRKRDREIVESNIVENNDIKIRHIALFFDGTGNDRDSRTNVNRLHETIRNQDRPDIITYYNNGVGSGFLLDKVSGGALGVGFTEDVRLAYKFLADNYRKGDKVYFFGFSRGAYTARVLSSLIYYAGLLDTKSDVFKDKEWAYDTDEYDTAIKKINLNRVSNAIKDIYTIFEGFEGQTDDVLKKKKEKFDKLMKAERNFQKRDDIDVFEKRNTPDYPMRRMTIDVIAVWDTVESLGLDVVTRAINSVYRPGSDGFKKRCRERHHHNYDTSAFPNIKNIYHAVAIDEKRALFWPVLYKWRCNETLTIPFDTEVKEVWFSGMHSDVGGGYNDSKDLAGISLNWMIDNIIEFTTSIKKDLCEGTSECKGILPSNKYEVYQNPLAKMHASWDDSPYEYTTPYERIIPKGSVIHPSVIERYSACESPRIKKANTFREPTGIYRPNQFSCVDMQNASKTDNPLIYPNIETGQCKRTGFEMCPQAYQRADKNCDYKNNSLARTKPFGVQRSVSLNANDACFATGLYLEKGITYAFDAKIGELKEKVGEQKEKTCKLKDKSICVEDYGVDGFKAEDIKDLKKRKLMHSFRNDKRVKERNWFSLVGALYNEKESGYHFSVGKNSSLTVPVSGRLFFYLNDAPEYYGNNEGSVDITLKKTSNLQHAQNN